MRVPRVSEALVGTLAGAGVALLLVLSEYLRVRQLIDTSTAPGRADLRDSTVAALLAIAPAFLSCLCATLVLRPVRLFRTRMALGAPLSVALGFAGFVPIHRFSYIDIPPEEASHIWVGIPHAYVFASLVSASVAVLVSSLAIHVRRRHTRNTPRTLPEA